MKTFREIAEGIQKGSDAVVDRVIRDEWDGKALTFNYNFESSVELSKVVQKVLTSKDGKYMYIPFKLSKEAIALIKSLKLKEIK